MDEFIPSLEHSIYEYFKRSDYLPLKQHELARALGLKGKDRNELRRLLRELESRGKIVRLRKNRWALPDTGRLKTGVLSVHRSGFGFVTPDNTQGEDVFIPRAALGVALHGDRVQISVIKMPARGGRKNQPVSVTPPRSEGRILKVLERRNSRIVGMLRQTPYYWYVIPDNPRILEDIRVREFGAHLAEPRDLYKVTIELDPWESPARPLSGVVVEILGPADQPGIEIVSIMRAHQLEEDFPEDAVKAAQDLPTTPGEKDLEGRRDLRALTTFTIDPEDAKDYDDAISLEKESDSTWKLGVHIADVAHYVTRGSAIDQEALERGTSVYLVDRVISMLPPHLTKDVCSLRPNVDRLTHSVEMILDGKGRIVRSTMFPSVIHSSARLTYTAVQSLFDRRDDHGIDPKIVSVISDMRGLAKAMRRKRIREGSLAFTLPEVKCVLNKLGEVTGIVKRVSNEAYRLIEEFMLAANREIAQRLADAEVPAIYRVHPEPDEDKWAQMAAALDAVQVHAAPHSQAELNVLSRDMSGSPLNYMVHLLILRNLNRALYSPHLSDHFGLAFSHYTHFTSPIRRYPDLLVHRILNALEEGAPPPYPAEELARMAGHCSEKERDAEEAENESVEMKRLAYYQKNLWDGATGPYAGVIVSIFPKGLVVELAESLQKGMIPFGSFTDDYYVVDEARGRATGRRYKRAFALGDPVQVEVVKVDMARRQVDFILAEDEPPRRRKRRRKK